uniref:Uncharacterized protein n=1 Tax=Clytia hemisphaerica TaxID=252671 RepID=A0A7M5XDL0_9CNID
MASKVKAQRTCTLCKNDNRNKNDFNCISQPLKEDLSAFCWILQKKMPKDFASDDSCRICNKCKKKIVRMKKNMTKLKVEIQDFLSKMELLTDTETLDSSRNISNINRLTSDRQTFNAETSDTKTFNTGTSDRQTFNTETSDRQTFNAETSDRQTFNTETSDRQTFNTETSDRQTSDTKTIDMDTLDKVSTSNLETSNEQTIDMVINDDRLLNDKETSDTHQNDTQTNNGQTTVEPASDAQTSNGGNESVLEMKKCKTPKAFIHVHWPSGERNREIKSDLNPLAVCLLRGTYSDIAKKCWKHEVLKKEIFKLVQKDIDNETVMICKKKVFNWVHVTSPTLSSPTVK